MEARIKSTPLDALDEERFEAMLDSPEFARYRQRLAEALERARTDCETQCEVPLMRSQGTVRGLRLAAALPEAMLAEMRGKGKR